MPPFFKMHRAHCRVEVLFHMEDNRKILLPDKIEWPAFRKQCRVLCVPVEIQEQHFVQTELEKIVA